jgi:hypothetical protein
MVRSYNNNECLHVNVAMMVTVDWTRDSTRRMKLSMNGMEQKRVSASYVGKGPCLLAVSRGCVGRLSIVDFLSWEWD